MALGFRGLEFGNSCWHVLRLKIPQYVVGVGGAPFGFFLGGGGVVTKCRAPGAAPSAGEDGPGRCREQHRGHQEDAAGVRGMLPLIGFLMAFGVCGELLCFVLFIIIIIILILIHIIDFFLGGGFAV